MVERITKNILNEYTLIGFVLGFLPMFFFFFNKAHGISNQTGFIGRLVYGSVAGIIFGVLTFLLSTPFIKNDKIIAIGYLLILIIVYIVFLQILWWLSIGPF